MTALHLAKRITIAGSLTALAACTTLTPELDARFGLAMEQARAQQTLNPDASRRADGPQGIDGVAASESVERYRSSFRTPPAQSNVFAIGIGQGSDGGNR